MEARRGEWEEVRSRWDVDDRDDSGVVYFFFFFFSFFLVDTSIRVEIFSIRKILASELN